MLRVRQIAAVALLGILAAGALVRAEEAEMTPGRYWYFVDNVKVTGDAPEVRVWAALPVEHRGQKVAVGDIYPEPAAVVEDPFGKTKIVFWRQTDVADGEDFYFYYDFKYAGEEVNADVDPGKIEPYDEASPEYQRYTVSEPWLEVTDGIRARAREIVGDETNPYVKAKMIFDWVVYNIRYEVPDPESRGAAKAFARRSGDCGDFSNVFCAMCRAEGIPARTVTACWPFGGGHVWAEALIPPYGWVPADASMAAMFIPGGAIPATAENIDAILDIMGMPTADPNWLFGNLYPKRLIVSVGNNFPVKDPNLGVAKVFRFLQPGGTGAYPMAEEYLDLSDKTVGAGIYVYGEGYDDLALARKTVLGDLGYTFFLAGEYAKAEEILLATVEENPAAEGAWLSLGQIYLEQGKTDDAVDALHKALDGKGGPAKPILDAQCHNYLGVCYQQKGDLEAARREFIQVMASGIDNEGLLAIAEGHLDKVMLALE